MLTLGKDITLYHGSYCEVQTPDLAKCARYKDFGQGFYLTTSEEQAARFAMISLRKAMANGVLSHRQGYGVVSVFRCPADRWSRLSICEFETADARWLHCVVAHRKAKGFDEVLARYSRYDIVCGKIANDATNAVITAYMAGVYGAVESERASQLCVSLLLPERLKDQCCFRTQRALKALDFKGSYQVWK